MASDEREASTLNDVNASFTVNSQGQISATVPAGAQTGSIQVTTPGGTITSTGVFTVIQK